MDWKWSSTLIAALAVITMAGCTSPNLEPGTESAPAIPTTASLMPTPTPEPMAEAAEVSTEESAEGEAAILPTPTAEAEAQADSSSPLTPEQESILAGLRNQGAAPELTNETWINSEPLQLADLRGNVVIVEFWTYG